jgi:hypothetical protein
LDVTGGCETVSYKNRTKVKMTASDVNMTVNDVICYFITRAFPSSIVEDFYLGYTDLVIKKVTAI